MANNNVPERIKALLLDMADLHAASVGEMRSIPFQLVAADMMEEAAEIVREIDMDEAGDDAAAVGKSINDVVYDLFYDLPDTAEGWAKHASVVGTLEYLHYQLMQIAEEMRAIGVLVLDDAAAD